jgi:2-polyprenyl-6-methoxyphenol hydroxylase-like FAD-dependent oxidoreductase
MWTKGAKTGSDGKLPAFEDYLYFAISTTPSGERPRTAEDRCTLLQQLTRDWHPSLKAIFDSASHDGSSCIPVLSSRPDIEIQTSGRTGQVTLIGDAAHPMSPMGGSGGDTAIQNAVDLASTIVQQGVSEESLRTFQERMQKRAQEKIEHSFRGGQKFWRGREWHQYQEVDARAD